MSEPAHASTPNDPAPPRDVRVAHLRTIAGWSIGLGLLLYFFAPAKVLLLGVLATSAIASALHPLMHILPGPKVLRAVIAGLLPFVLAAAVATSAWLLFKGQIERQVAEWPAARAQLDATLAGYSTRVGLAEPVTVSTIARGGLDALTGQGGGGKFFATAAGAASGVLIALAFVFFGSMYLLDDEGRSLAEPVRAVLPGHRRAQFDAAIVELVPRLRGWVLATMLSMTVVGVASCVAYWLVGLKLALAVGVLTGLSEIVPTLGPALTFGVALLSAAGDGGDRVLLAVAAYAFVQVLESYVVTPLVMKRAVRMPPIITLFTVVLWGQVFGAGGLLLAIPINLVIWTFVDHLVVRPRRAREGVTAA